MATLSRILKEFRDTDGPINLNELSQRLGVERSALDGMLDLLVRQGKLREIDSFGCASCKSHRDCAHTSHGSFMGKTYVLAD